jgi:hypothetical protein
MLHQRTISSGLRCPIVTAAANLCILRSATEIPAMMATRGRLVHISASVLPNPAGWRMLSTNQTRRSHWLLHPLHSQHGWQSSTVRSSNVEAWTSAKAALLEHHLESTLAHVRHRHSKTFSLGQHHFANRLWTHPSSSHPNSMHLSSSRQSSTPLRKRSRRRRRPRSNLRLRSSPRHL